MEGRVKFKTSDLRRRQPSVILDSEGDGMRTDLPAIPIAYCGETAEEWYRRCCESASKLEEAERDFRTACKKKDEENEAANELVAQLQQQLAESDHHRDEWRDTAEGLQQQLNAALEQRNQHLKREQTLEQQLAEARKLLQRVKVCIDAAMDARR